MLCEVWVSGCEVWSMGIKFEIKKIYDQKFASFIFNYSSTFLRSNSNPAS